MVSTNPRNYEGRNAGTPGKWKTRNTGTENAKCYFYPFWYSSLFWIDLVLISTPVYTRPRAISRPLPGQMSGDVIVGLDILIFRMHQLFQRE